MTSMIWSGISVMKTAIFRGSGSAATVALTAFHSLSDEETEIYLWSEEKPQKLSDLLIDIGRIILKCDIDEIEVENSETFQKDFLKRGAIDSPLLEVLDRN